MLSEPCLNVHLHDIVSGKYKNAVYAKYEAHRENGKGEWVREGKHLAVSLSLYSGTLLFRPNENRARVVIKEGGPWIGVHLYVHGNVKGKVL